MIRGLFFLLLFFASFQCWTQENIKVISYNIRYDNPKDGKDAWEHRRDGLASFLAGEEADFIGLQEVLHRQLLFVKGFLLDYKHIGVGRDDADTLGEYAPIFYNALEWELLDHKYRWLSQTPNVVSKGWDSNFNRMLTYGLFRNLNSGDTIAVFNTHFDHRAQEARKNSAHLVVKWMDEFSDTKHKVITGDFNLSPEDPNYQVLTERAQDSREHALEKHEDHKGTFSSFKLEGDFETRIDYIFVEKEMKVLKYDCFELKINGRHMSDHFPIIATIES